MLRGHWRPIVDDDHLRLPSLQTMIVARVRDRRCTSEILPLLHRVYPWTPSLKHVRRLHQDGDQLDVLLYPSDHSNPLETRLFHKFFDEATRLVNIPRIPCSLRWQYDQCRKDHWPNLAFRENTLLEESQLTKTLTEKEQLVLDLLRVNQSNSCQ